MAVLGAERTEMIFNPSPASCAEAERNEQEIGAEQEGKRDGALRGVVHVKSSWREEEVYVASGNHFSVVHGARGVFMHADAPSLV